MLSIDLSPAGIKLLCGRCQGRGEIMRHDEAGSAEFGDCPDCDGIGALSLDQAARLRDGEMSEVIAALQAARDQIGAAAKRLESLQAALQTPSGPPCLSCGRTVPAGVETCPHCRHEAYRVAGSTCCCVACERADPTRVAWEKHARAGGD